MYGVGAVGSVEWGREAGFNLFTKRRRDDQFRFCF